MDHVFSEAFESMTVSKKYFWPGCLYLGFSGDSDDKESACDAGDPGSTPGLGRSPAEGIGNPLQHSCVKNSVDRKA